MTGARLVYTYRELLDEVARFAGSMLRLGVKTGDRVVIYMPMIPESVIAMLACARIGAVHSVVFGGFAAHELAARIDDAEPVLIITASGGLEPGRRIEYPPIVLQALDLAQTTAARNVIVKHRDGFDPMRFPADQAATDSLPASSETVAARWLDWDDATRDAEPAAPVSLAATDPLYILYTSGTTGKPKGVVRDNGGHAVALAWSMRNIYDVDGGQVMLTTSDIGWVVGHSYIVYAPLLVGATTVLYEGKPIGTPDAGAFWRMVDEYKVDVMFTAPTALRAIRRADPRPRPPAATTCPRCAPCSARASAWTRPLTSGPSRPCSRTGPTARSWITGGRPRPAGLFAPIRSGCNNFRSRPVPPRCRCPDTGCACWTRTAMRCRPIQRAISSSGCRCRPAP